MRQVRVALRDAAVAPVPAVAEDLGLGDEVQRHALASASSTPARQLEVDRVAEQHAVLVAARRSKPVSSAAAARAAGAQRQARPHAAARPAARAGAAAPNARSRLRRRSEPGGGGDVMDGGRCHRSLLDQGVEEAVGRGGRQGRTAAFRHCRAAAAGARAMAGSRRERRRRLALQKSVDLVLALGLEHRAGAVQQPAARREQRPERVEQPGLGRAPARRCRWRGAASARRDGGARCPRRCTARRAGSRRTAGRPTRPPGAPASAASGRALQAEAGERVVARGPGAPGRGRAPAASRSAQLEQVRRLAARRGAGVEHARAAAAAAGAEQQRRGALGGGVLHRDLAVGEARAAARPARGWASATACAPGRLGRRCPRAASARDVAARRRCAGR